MMRLAIMMVMIMISDDGGDNNDGRGRYDHGDDQ
jgi:hypothetical protein